MEWTGNGHLVTHTPLINNPANPTLPAFGFPQNRCVVPSLYWIQGVEADMGMTIICCCCLTVILAVKKKKNPTTSF